MKIRQKRERLNPGKRNVFESLVTASLLVVFILVIIGGILSYNRLNQITQTVNNSVRPDRVLILVKEINNNLSEAENSVKSFSLTRSQDYIVRFYELTENTGEKFDELENLVHERRKLMPYIDTLNQLVGEKFTILDRLLSVLDEFRVQQAMQQVVESIREEEFANLAAGKETEISAIDTTAVGKEGKKDNFFNRLFKKKNKKTEDAPDSVEASVTKELTLSLDQINEKVGQVRNEVVSKDLKERQEEWELLQQDKIIMEKIRVLLTFLEENEKANLLKNTQEAEHKVSELRMITIAFGVIASLFIILAGLVVYRYVKRNNEYRTILEKARKDAEELAKAKELFLANMSHEIRTPMNIISGFLDQIMQSDLNTEQREQLSIIRKSSDHLLRLLNDLLDLSRLQADRLSLSETNFSPEEVILDIHQSFEPAARKKDIQLLVEVEQGFPAVVYGDPLRLRQILFNLAGNAVKFTDHGKITIKASLSKTPDEETGIVYEVSDTGIGIPEHELQKIFGVFDKGIVMPGRNEEGAGLGLAITRKLVELLKGKLRVESKAGEGSVFTVEIPYQEKQDDLNTQASLVKDDKPFSDLKILVVDDDEFNRRLARTILEKYGSPVAEAGSAEEAISMIRNLPFDLVLMDIRLPGMKGPEAAREIKKIGKSSGIDIPVIAVSAAITEGEPEKYDHDGLDDFIKKPYREETLVGIVHKYHRDKSAKPFYDLEPLRKSSNGNDEFFREMVSLFIRDTGEGLEAIRKHTKKEEWEQAGELAHKLLSPCRHLKAEKLSGLLKRLEQMRIEKKPVDSVHEILDEATTEFAKIAKDISLTTEQ
jgi:signal transduction histidine kinase/CheY-like chemotaxis protein/HPt (histidine-containing phosphotransfer) domain-containing protein